MPSIINKISQKQQQAQSRRGIAVDTYFPAKGGNYMINDFNQSIQDTAGSGFYAGDSTFSHKYSSPSKPSASGFSNLNPPLQKQFGDNQYKSSNNQKSYKNSIKAFATLQNQMTNNAPGKSSKAEVHKGRAKFVSTTRNEERCRMEDGDYDIQQLTEEIVGRSEQLKQSIDSQQYTKSMPQTIDPETVANLKQLIGEENGQKLQQDPESQRMFTLDKDGSLHKKHKNYDQQRRQNEVSVYVESNQQLAIRMLGSQQLIETPKKEGKSLSHDADHPNGSLSPHIQAYINAGIATTSSEEENQQYTPQLQHESSNSYFNHLPQQ